MKLGTVVLYPEAARPLYSGERVVADVVRHRRGTIDKTAIHPGQKLYRVDDRWFAKEYLRAV